MFRRSLRLCNRNLMYCNLWTLSWILLRIIRLPEMQFSPERLGSFCADWFKQRALNKSILTRTNTPPAKGCPGDTKKTNNSGVNSSNRYSKNDSSGISKDNVDRLRCRTASAWNSIGKVRKYAERKSYLNDAPTKPDSSRIPIALAKQLKWVCFCPRSLCQWILAAIRNYGPGLRPYVAGKND